MDTQLTENALQVLQYRYLAKNEKGELLETPADMFMRVAKAVAGAEAFWGVRGDVIKWQKTFFEALSRLWFLPNSPTLMNAGTGVSQLSACFVLPVADSMDAIFSTLRQTALIQQSGGGTGFNFSQLRPKNDFVGETGGVASGPVSFMKIFNAATEHIKQGGRRRGANMGILNVDHPDIEEFVDAKLNEGELSGFNISIGMTDAFMKAVEKNERWELKHPARQHVVKLIAAKKLWDEIVSAAWHTGDPGLVFLDTINAGNPTPQLGKIEATNPCGEVPLLPYEACNLGSVNLPKFLVRDNKSWHVDWTGLERIIKVATRFLDDVVEINNYLFPEIKSMVWGNRKIGLGVMGWADMLAMLEIPYDSDEALTLAAKLMQFFQEMSFEASVELARERDVFNNWARSVYYPNRPVRNATRISIAPTGSISLIAGSSSSIEPLFALAYRHKEILNSRELVSVNPHFVNYLQKHHLYTPAIIDRVMKTGTAQLVKDIPSEAKGIFKTALEIKPEWHLRHQAVFQQYTDNAVSKTINLPQNASKEDVSHIYKMAWQQKLKGITIFRYGCRQQQVLHTGIDTRPGACKVCVDESI